MTAPPLSSIRIRGFRSIVDVELPLSSPVTLLVGANGSGKSNIVAAFELLGRIVDRSFQEELLRRGGLAAQLHRSPSGADASEAELSVWGEVHEGPHGAQFRNGYVARLQAATDDSALLLETTRMHDVDRYDQPYDRHLPAGRETHLHEAARKHPANQHVVDVLQGCRVFHFDDTSVDAPPLRRSSTADDQSLHWDGANVAALLHRLRISDRSRYDRIVRSVRTVAPFFDDFVVEPQQETVVLRWREKGLDGIFSGSALSSGTLRFICLAVLLQQSHPPATIVLDEPELGLHPFAIHQLADLMHEASERRRIVAATQSVTLLGQFGIDEIATVDRVGGVTTVNRPDADALTEWLDQYSLGDLWEMNLLGGRPQPSGAT